MKFSTIICKGCVHKVNILILLICVEMAQSEIQSTIFASRQSITQNDMKRSHGSVTSVVRATSKWEKANLPLLPHPHRLTDSHEILHT